MSALLVFKYNCESCQYKTNDKPNFNKHSKAQHQGAEYSCNLCSKIFRSISGRNNHKKTSHEGVRYECTGCKKLFTQVKSLQSHVKSKHNGELQSQESINCFKCNDCNKYFRTKSLGHTCGKKNKHCTPTMTLIQGYESVQPTIDECNKRKKQIFSFMNIKDCFHDEEEEEPASESASPKIIKTADEEGEDDSSESA